MAAGSGMPMIFLVVIPYVFVERMLVDGFLA